jgi:predicted lactoylglutathione lyase
MPFKKIWANLAVTDPIKSHEFYLQMGFIPNVAEATAEMTSFVFGEEKFIIHFFCSSHLEKAMNNKISTTEKSSGVIFSISAASKEDVIQWAGNAEKYGGKVYKPAQRHEDGYFYCVFADPDDHKFNALLMEEGM